MRQLSQHERGKVSCGPRSDDLLEQSNRQCCPTSEGGIRSEHALKRCPAVPSDFHSESGSARSSAGSTPPTSRSRCIRKTGPVRGDSKSATERGCNKLRFQHSSARISKGRVLTWLRKKSSLRYTAVLELISRLASCDSIASELNEGRTEFRQCIASSSSRVFILKSSE